jgi:hypothetical protein
MLTRDHDPYSGHRAPSARDLEAEAAAALAEITGTTPDPDARCVMCGKPEKPTHDLESPGDTVKHPFLLERERPPRKAPAKRTTTRRRPARTRKAPPPPQVAQ